MSEILYEYGAITSVEQKPTKTGKHFYVYQMNGKKFSSFEDLELVLGNKGRMTYKVNGQYNNAMGFILGDGIAPQEGKPVVEEVLDNVISPTHGTPAQKQTLLTFDEKKRKEITLGQACNLAQQSLFNSSFNADTFDVLFKEEVRKYFRLLQELQQELL